MCTVCNPELVDGFKASGDWCEAHGFPESVCPSCNPMQPPGSGAGVEAGVEARVVRLRKPPLEEVAGIRTSPVVLGETSPEVACTARIAFDGDQLAELRAPVPGVVSRVLIELGAEVEKGAALVELQSPKVGELQAASQSARQWLRSAEANLRRKRGLYGIKAVSERDVEVAQRELADAKAKARSADTALGLIGAQAAGAPGHFVLTAPLSGTVIQRGASLGMLATAETSLATLANTSTMWARCDVPEVDASRVRVGQAVSLTVSGLDDGPRRGAIAWISAAVDPRTRTVAAYARLPNPDGRLRAEQFATARIDVDVARISLSVPRAAIQRVEGQEIVFVRTAEGLYEPRVVKPWGQGDPVAVKGRLEEGDEVVTTGAALLRTEAMPGSIGAGCCEVH